MQDLIKIDGRYYNVAITSLKRTHNITDGDNAGRTKAPLAIMIRDIIGTFISYTVSFEVKGEDVDEYNDLVTALSQPVDYVPIVMPDGQAFDAYITKVEDSLVNNLGGVRRWGELSVTFTPMTAQIYPS